MAGQCVIMKNITIHFFIFVVWTGPLCTAYHPAANGIVERMHRQLKAAIMCNCNNSSTQWTESLSLVLLGMRSSWKDDLQASPAELVYGEPLILPGQFLSPKDDYTTTDVTLYATRLRSHMAKLTPRPTSWHTPTSSPFYIPRDLTNSSHVFLRQDRLRGSLEPPYAGPFKVIERTRILETKYSRTKYFTLDVQNKKVNVSIDRLKPAYVAREEAVTQSADVKTSTNKYTRSGRRVQFPDFYRP